MSSRSTRSDHLSSAPRGIARIAFAGEGRRERREFMVLLLSILLSILVNLFSCYD